VTTTNPGLQTLFAQAGRLRLLSSTREVELARRRDAGDPEAVRTLVEHNLRLAFWRAKNWQNRGLPYEDLIQEGVFGLERAAQKFDPKKKVRFSTYATTWIDHFMQRAISRDDFVPYVVRRRRQKSEELQEKGHTVEEIAARLKCTVADVVDALESSNIMASLDDESSPYDRIMAPEPDDASTERVRDAISLLPELEAKLMRLRHGLDGDEPITRAEAAKRLGITSREVGRLEASAAESLRGELGDLQQDVELQECVELGPEKLEVICAR
jgi:RNA polymerase primary sigma factor